MIHYCKKFGTKLDDLDVPGKLQNAAKSHITLGQAGIERGKPWGTEVGWMKIAISHATSLF